LIDASWKESTGVSAMATVPAVTSQTTPNPTGTRTSTRRWFVASRYDTPPLSCVIRRSVIMMFIALRATVRDRRAPLSY
jgi:hypothetical protein